MLRRRGHVLLPVRLGFVSRLANRFLAYAPLVRHLVWTNWLVARPVVREAAAPPQVSVVCPCRNEKDNIAELVRRLPSLGTRTSR